MNAGLYVDTFTGLSQLKPFTFPTSRARRPKAFWFFFFKSIDRNRIFHGVRGQRPKGLLKIKHKPFFELVDEKKLVSRDNM